MSISVVDEEIERVKTSSLAHDAAPRSMYSARSSRSKNKELDRAESRITEVAGSRAPSMQVK